MDLVPETSAIRLLEDKRRTSADKLKTILGAIADDRTYSEVRSAYITALQGDPNQYSHLMPENMDSSFFQSFRILDDDPNSLPSWMIELFDTINTTKLSVMAQKVLEALENNIIWFGRTSDDVAFFSGSFGENDDEEGIGLYIASSSSASNSSITVDSFEYQDFAYQLYSLYKKMTVLSNPQNNHNEIKLRYPTPEERMIDDHGTEVQLSQFPILE